jgi:hypothetical protein
VSDADRDRALSVSRFTIGASAATCFAVVAVANALRPDPTLAQRGLVQEVLARQGLSIPLPPAPGFDWAGTITPGALAVLLVVLSSSCGRPAPPGRDAPVHRRDAAMLAPLVGVRPEFSWLCLIPFRRRRCRSRRPGYPIFTEADHDGCRLSPCRM